MKLIDIENWNRKEHFEFFSNFANPQLSIVTELDCTKSYQSSKFRGESFFAHYLHKSMIAVNFVKEFRLRIIKEKVYELDLIHAGSTIARDDGTFAFALIPFSHDFKDFSLSLKKEISAVQASSGLRLFVENGRTDLIRHTTLPWIHFTGLMHPAKFDKADSIPKISFGKMIVRDDGHFLPISIEVHHGLIDGLHVHHYLQKFQDLLNEV